MIRMVPGPRAFICDYPAVLWSESVLFFVAMPAALLLISWEGWRKNRPRRNSGIIGLIPVCLAACLPYLFIIRSGIWASLVRDTALVALWAVVLSVVVAALRGRDRSILLRFLGLCALLCYTQFTVWSGMDAHPRFPDEVVKITFWATGLACLYLLSLIGALRRG